MCSVILDSVILWNQNETCDFYQFDFISSKSTFSVCESIITIVMCFDRSKRITDYNITIYYKN